MMFLFISEHSMYICCVLFLLSSARFLFQWKITCSYLVSSIAINGEVKLFKYLHFLNEAIILDTKWLSCSGQHIFRPIIELFGAPSPFGNFNFYFKLGTKLFFLQFSFSSLLPVTILFNLLTTFYVHILYFAVLYSIHLTIFLSWSVQPFYLPDIELLIWQGPEEDPTLSDNVFPIRHFIQMFSIKIDSFLLSFA